MKFVLLVFITVLITSCGMFRRAQEKYVEENAAGYDKSLGTVVIKRDSSIISYDAIKIKTPLFKKSKFILDGDLEIPYRDVLAYQTATTYFTTTPLCGFTTRRIELAPISTYQGYYTRTETEYGTGNNAGMTRTRTRTYYQSYLQKANGNLVTYTPNNLRTLVDNYAPSIELLDQYDKQRKKLKSIGWLNTGIFFAGMIVAASSQAGSQLTVANYLGLGVSTASIVYGFINRKKKVRNYVNVTEALEEYNRYYKRKK